MVQGPWRLAIRRFRRHKLGMLAFYTLIALYVVSIFAGFFAPYDYEDEVRERIWQQHWNLVIIDEAHNAPLGPAAEVSGVSPA